MTLDELIAYLLDLKEAEMPGDTPIMVDGYEGDYDTLEPENIRQMRVEYKGYDSDYFGNYEQRYPSDELGPNDHPIFTAIVLGRE